MDRCLKTIGSNIRKIRKSQHLTIEDLAGKSGVSNKYLQSVETAKNNISVLKLQSIAEALHVHLTDLVSEEDADDALEHKHEPQPKQEEALEETETKVEAAPEDDAGGFLMIPRFRSKKKYIRV